MGRKQAGSRKQIHFCIAVLITFVVAGCSFWPINSIKQGKEKVDDPGTHLTAVDDPATHLMSGRKLFGEGDFTGALREYEKVSPPAASIDASQEALLYTGLIYSAPANPRRDYTKSVAYFKRLVEGYPRSPFAEQAKIMLTIIRENEESSRAIERLKALIEASKKVDIGIEDRKREKIR